MNELTAALRSIGLDVDRVIDQQPLSGGCISRVSRCRLGHPGGGESLVVVKQNEDSFEENFRSEADGLAALAEPDAIGVPKPLACGRAAGQALLVTEWKGDGERPSGFFAEFGRRLAALHRVTLGTSIGWHQDNFLGSARQPNGPTDRWPEFVAQRRIGFQIGWAVDQGLATPSLVGDCEQIVSRMEDLLSGRRESTSLLHGDLWGGNYLSGPDGEPVILDPAVSRGCREAEFGMLRLFGSCPAEFYDAYQQAFPMPDGWQRRVSVYVLYHLLNHLNLFGSGYRGQCESLAAEILRA